MEEATEPQEKPAMIPIISDAVRNIDKHQMVRCSYFTIQSDDPLSTLTLNTSSFDSPTLLLNLEAILIGSPGNYECFEKPQDIIELYNFVEDREDLFIDISDIWVPLEWFGEMEIKQGMLFRIPDSYFSLCWKLRNDRISTEELYRDSSLYNQAHDTSKQREPIVVYAEEETAAFAAWTKMQIEQSRERYYAHKGVTLKKIKE